MAESRFMQLRNAINDAVEAREHAVRCRFTANGSQWWNTIIAAAEEVANEAEALADKLIDEYWSKRQLPALMSQIGKRLT